MFWGTIRFRQIPPNRAEAKAAEPEDDRRVRGLQRMRRGIESGLIAPRAARPSIRSER